MSSLLAGAVLLLLVVPGGSLDIGRSVAVPAASQQRRLGSLRLLSAAASSGGPFWSSGWRAPGRDGDGAATLMAIRGGDGEGVEGEQEHEGAQEEVAHEGGGAEGGGEGCVEEEREAVPEPGGADQAAAPPPAEGVAGGEAPRSRGGGASLLQSLSQLNQFSCLGQIGARSPGDFPEGAEASRMPSVAKISWASVLWGALVVTGCGFFSSAVVMLFFYKFFALLIGAAKRDARGVSQNLASALTLMGIVAGCMSGGSVMALLAHESPFFQAIAVSLFYMFLQVINPVSRKAALWFRVASMLSFFPAFILPTFLRHKSGRRA